MKPRFVLSNVVVLLLLMGCNQATETINTAPKPKVVQLTTVTIAQADELFTFPAKIDAYRNVDIAFQVAGKITDLNLVEGQEIMQGQLMAALDSGPFERNLRQSKVKLEQAQHDLTRLKKLVAQNIGSQKDLDNAQTAFDLASIEWENRKADLAYSQLYAPFDAKVSKRFIEKDSYVGVGKTIVSLQDVSKLYFEIQVPERLVSAHQGEKITHAQAFIGGSINQTFDVTYAEHNTQPDPTTQTYKVIFAMANPKHLKISTGLNATITIKSALNSQQAILLPIHALATDSSGAFYVWRYNAEQGTVAKAPVTVGEINQGFVPVLSGLTQGEKIVVAGISQMYENLAVTPYTGE